jgi:hypothetical protein
MKRMKKLVLMLLLAATSLAAVPAYAQEPDGEFRDFCMDYLREEGYVPRLDEDGDIAFKVEGIEYYLITPAVDTDILQLAWFGWDFDDDAEKTRAFVAANAVNASVKIGKLYVLESRMGLDVYQFVSSTRDVRVFFPRMLQFMRNTLSRFRERMNELEKEMQTD